MVRYKVPGVGNDEGFKALQSRLRNVTDSTSTWDIHTLRAVENECIREVVHGYSHVCADAGLPSFLQTNPGFPVYTHVRKSIKDGLDIFG